MVTSGTEDMHGGELETSLLLHVAPEVVSPGYDDEDWVVAERTHMHVRGLAAYIESGLVGRPSLATAEKGRLAQDLVFSCVAPIWSISSADSAHVSHGNTWRLAASAV